MSDFGTILTAMITPFKEDNPSQIDYPATEKLIKHLINNGTDSLVITGTTGESPTLTHEEEIELLKFTREVLKKQNSKCRIIFGAGSNCTQTAIKMSKLGEEHGADALLIVTPYYNKPNQKGLIEHFSLIAKSTKLPIILYNVPGRTNISLQYSSIVTLVETLPNIYGLKEASTNIDLISKLRTRFTNKEFKIYSGDDSLTLSMLAVGADGVISVASHLVGNEMKAMVTEFQKAKLEEAKKIHLKLFPLFEALFTEPNPTCIKEALLILGFSSNRLRAPLVNLDSNQKESLKKVIEATTKIKTVV
jgi:4-hydroxy-tetrahydrodipicolinate synthase